ncbi:MAG TPA: sulfite exporter TauE/SafE family protein [Candidatus Dormibacteraeota bacterium]
MHFDILVAVAGLIVGLAVGLTGMGGGALMTPVLVLLFGVQPLAAVSSDLVASLIMKPAGVLVHLRRRTMNWRLVGWLAAGSVPTAFLGVVVLRALGHGSRVQTIVQLALGAVLLLGVVAMLVRAAIDQRRPGSASSARVRPLPTLVIGAAVGFVLGMTSTGSGTLVIVSLMLLYPSLRGSQLVGTDLTQALPMVGSAALAHIFFGDFKLGLTLSIVAGSIPGVVIGALISSRASTRFLRPALAIVMLASGLKLLNMPTLALGIALASATLVVLIVAAGRAASHRIRPGVTASIEAS